LTVVTGWGRKKISMDNKRKFDVINEEEKIIVRILIKIK
jgi:hypothetical protein